MTTARMTKMVTLVITAMMATMMMQVMETATTMVKMVLVWVVQTHSAFEVIYSAEKNDGGNKTEEAIVATNYIIQSPLIGCGKMDVLARADWSGWIIHYLGEIKLIPPWLISLKSLFIWHHWQFKWVIGINGKIIGKINQWLI